MRLVEDIFESKSVSIPSIEKAIGAFKSDNGDPTRIRNNERSSVLSPSKNRRNLDGIPNNIDII